MYNNNNLYFQTTKGSIEFRPTCGLELWANPGYCLNSCFEQNFFKASEVMFPNRTFTTGSLSPAGYKNHYIISNY